MGSGRKGGKGGRGSGSNQYLPQLLIGDIRQFGAVVFGDHEL